MGTMGGFFDAIGGLVKAILVIVLIVIALIFLGYAVGHCAALPQPQPPPAAEKKIVVPEPENNFIAAPRRGKDGAWCLYVWQLEKGRLENLRIYKIVPLDKGE